MNGVDLAHIEAGTEHGAPRPNPGPGKTRPRHNRPRRTVLDCQTATVRTARGPVLVIAESEITALLNAAMFCAAIDQARRAASRTASRSTSCP